jgi:outer membrane protein OmpA-like peptidoglycan-associated protein
MRRLALAAAASTLGLLLAATSARADEPQPPQPLRAHAELGVAHAATTPQSRELGLGAAAAVSLELPLGTRLGIEGKLSGTVLAAGKPPLDPSLAARGTGTVGMASMGLRVRPFGDVAGPWASAAFGFAQTGSRGRLGLEGQIGWDVRVGQGRLDVGPYLGWLQVVQPEDTLRPEDARIAVLGVHVGLGVPRRLVARGDRDGDGVLDESDACPDVKGVRTSDPLTNGCPPRNDRDHDGVLDPEDACPDVPGVRTSDPQTNGCPPPDRDGDGVLDADDACPDVPGVRTSDPATNGCPRPDRDGDGVFDAEDACPDLPGVRTSDPATNGCPEAQGNIRVDNERIVLDDVILFDLDSPRVRHRSWPALERLARFIRTNPGILEVSIEGHADATGTEEHNLVLSRERAESVKRLLVRFGVEDARLKAEAFGRSRLRVQTLGPEAKNRRVEFWVTRTKTSGEPDAASPTSPTKDKKER